MDAIKYDYRLTPQEMADAAGVSVAMVRNYLQRNKNIHYREDRAKYLKGLVQDYFKKNPGVKIEKAAEDLKLSRPTIKKYLSQEIVPKNQKKLVKSLGNSGLSVGNSDAEILRTILNIYLPGRLTFDCDLTFGDGKFYAGGLSVPEHRYDKNKYGDNGSKKHITAPLDEVKNLPDECFSSVVIDLPIYIDNNASDTDSFESLSKMFDSYKEMLALAYRLLKRGGLAIFKTTDFVLRNDDCFSKFSDVWATDYAIEKAMDLGFEFTDRFILAQHRYLATGSTKVRTGLKHGYFLVFTKA